VDQQNKKQFILQWIQKTTMYCIRKDKKMEMCYNGALVMPKNYAVVNEEEMTYVEGGGAKEIATNILCCLVSTALWEAGKKAVTSGMVEAALTAVGAAANAVWGAITSAAAFVWNTPVCLACLAGAVGIAVGICIGYYCL
jgi:hypothetical protein